LRRKEQLLNLHQLKIFNLVAKHLNILKAAREIRISQPTVSEQLRLLEEECGVKFIPGSRKGSVAKEGRLFWNALQPILRQVDDVQRMIGTAKGKRRTLIVIPNLPGNAAGRSIDRAHRQQSHYRTNEQAGKKEEVESVFHTHLKWRPPMCCQAVLRRNWA
jgi:DNA-binding transcriptional LysR family regulator